MFYHPGGQSNTASTLWGTIDGIISFIIQYYIIIIIIDSTDLITELWNDISSFIFKLLA